MIRLDLTHEEGLLLQQALDVTIRQGGLQAALHLVPLNNKLAAAAAAALQPAPGPMPAVES